MQKNSQNFSMQEALRLANSDAGQRLLAMLKNQNDPALHRAMEQAANGDYTAIRSSLSGFLQSAQVRQLLKELEDSHG